MAKMKIAPRDRPKVRAQCYRLLATLKLDPARSRLISGFIDTYLKLNAQEMQRFEREVAKFAPAEREATMEIMNYFESRGLEQGLEQGLQQGLQQGRQEGKEELVARLIERRFGSVTSRIADRLPHISAEQLTELAEALFDFTAPTDVEN